MRVSEIWRYPVKSMAGEPLTSAVLSPAGIVGDRLVHVRNSKGRVLTSRSKPRLLLLHATLGSDGEPLVDGDAWPSPEAAAKVKDAAGKGARLVREETGRFDILPLLVTTDGALAAFGHDRRRLRPNIVVAGVDGLAERTWEGRRLRIGAVIIGLEDLRRRCIMTTYDPDTAKQDLRVLQGIQRDFDGTFALNALVIEPGTIAASDPVELL